MTSEGATLYDELAGSPQGSAELAAARAASRVARLMGSAHKSSGLKQSTIADTLRVTKGRISQLLNSDGNVKVSSVAKVLDALGYELIVDARPKSDAVPELGRRAPRRTEDAASTNSVWAWKQHFASGDGIKCVVLLMDEIDGEHTALDRPTLLSVRPILRATATVRTHGPDVSRWSVSRQGENADGAHPAHV